MFWEAMVTTNSGTAIPAMACTLNVGMVHARAGTKAAGATGVPADASDTPMTPNATSRAAGTAHRGANFIISSQHRITGATKRGTEPRALNGARQSWSRTPASMAWARDVGMRAISLPSAGTRPVRASSSPAPTKPPTAAGHPPSGTADAASSAAPGVDQARVTGTRERQARNNTPSPTVRVTASRPDAAWAGLAPTAVRPARTTANDEVNPTSAVTIPAMTGLESVRTSPGPADVAGAGDLGIPAGYRRRFPNRQSGAPEEAVKRQRCGCRLPAGPAPP